MRGQETLDLAGTYGAQNSSYSGCHLVLVVQQLYQGLPLTIDHFSKMKKKSFTIYNFRYFNTNFRILKSEQGFQ